MGAKHIGGWHALHDDSPYEVFQPVRGTSARDIASLACATATVLTLHPTEERSSTSALTLDSHRRLDLAAQFQAAKLVIIVLHETRLSIPRALGIGPYPVFAATAGKRGQGGLELFGSYVLG